MDVNRGVGFLRLARSLLCCGLLALVMAGCADDAARLMYRSQSELTRHRRREAEAAAGKRAAERAAAKLQAEVAESEVVARTVNEGEARKRTLEGLEAALTVCGASPVSASA